MQIGRGIKAGIFTGIAMGLIYFFLVLINFKLLVFSDTDPALDGFKKIIPYSDLYTFTLVLLILVQFAFYLGTLLIEKSFFGMLKGLAFAFLFRFIPGDRALVKSFIFTSVVLILHFLVRAALLWNHTRMLVMFDMSLFFNMQITSPGDGIVIIYIADLVIESIFLGMFWEWMDLDLQKKRSAHSDMVLVE